MKQLSKNTHSDSSWLSIKLSFSFFWMVIIIKMIYGVEKCLYPTGICRLYSFEIFFTPSGKFFLTISCIILLLAYLFEFKMAYTTLLLFAISVIVITFHESNGIFFRATIFSVVWAAQSIAYFQRELNRYFDIKHFREQYACQAIAAVYILAAIAKLKASGAYWGDNANGFALQVLKNYLFQYYDSGSILILMKAEKLSGFFAEHSYITSSMLYTALFLELFCFIALINKNLKVILGIGLFFMHLGIAIFMGIGISAICFPMVIFFINPLNHLARGALFFKTKYLIV
jgi:hypothetical protein